MAREALARVGRQIANQARSRGVFESDRLNERLNDILPGGFPAFDVGPHYREKVFGSETKADETDARLIARMGSLHELVGEEFSIRQVHLTNPDAAALKVMVGDLSTLQKEITRRNQFQQITAATFPELKTLFRDFDRFADSTCTIDQFSDTRGIRFVC